MHPRSATVFELDDLDRERKNWMTLVARAAMRGWQLWRSDAADGPQRYFLGHHGLVRCCADSTEVERLLEQIGA